MASNPLKRKVAAIQAFALVLILIHVSASAQVLARFTVNAGGSARLNTPVSVCFDGYVNLPDSVLRLEETTEGRRIPVPFQIEEGKTKILWWILGGETKAGNRRVFELVKGGPVRNIDPVVSKFSDGTMVVSVDGRNVLQYNFKTVYPPSGVDPAYRRSGFIHPLWSTRGVALTCIQPKDHYHHYGIWNPWTKTRFEGREIDFWNLGSKQGTVRFKGFVSIVNGSVYGGFKALQEHVVYPDSTAEKTAMNEVWDVRVFRVPVNAFLWDFTSTLNLATDSPIVFEAYRYAGFGFRATETWTNQNSKALTSEGKTRKDADGSTGRWCMISGETEKGTAGILFLSHPSNYSHPEPIRMWPEDANNGRGDVFFNFSPTKNKDWSLAPRKDYTLKYRILVFEGDLDPAKAETVWTDFAIPPDVKVERVSP